MREYFFHLAFELHPNDPRSPRRAFHPPPNADIFASNLLPLHSTVPLSGSLSYTLPGSPRQRRKTDPTLSAPTGPLVVLPSHPKRSATSNRAPDAADQDWRFDRVSVISIDMAPPGASDNDKKDEAEPRPHAARGKSLSVDTETPSTAAPAAPPARRPTGLATKGRFIPTDPKNTELGWGVVHLYRDADETPGLYDAGETAPQDAPPFDADKCSTLCILAVPSYMGPTDLLGWLGERSREDVSHFRLIRTERANKYMVLMKFRDAKVARAWQKEWNGKPFNSMEVRPPFIIASAR
jgi:BRCA1-associated protein